MLFYARQYIFKTLSGFGCCLTGDEAVVDLVFIVAPIVLCCYARQYIFKTLSGFGCCLLSQAMMLWLLINYLLLLPLFCAVLCPSVYIQVPQWPRLLSVLTSGDAVVVDLVFIVAPIVLCCLYPSVYI